MGKVVIRRRSSPELRGQLRNQRHTFAPTEKRMKTLE
jgi:hypothetical protein